MSGNFYIYDVGTTVSTLVNTTYFTFAYDTDLNIRYDSADGSEHSVVFYVDDNKERVENVSPYYIGGDIPGGAVLVWGSLPANDLIKVSVIEYEDTNETGAVTNTDEVFLLFIDPVSTFDTKIFLPPADMTAVPALIYTFTMATTGYYRIVLRWACPARYLENDVWISSLTTNLLLTNNSTPATPQQTITAGEPFKVYSTTSGDRFSWETLAIDGDPHTLYINVTGAGDYLISIAGRSTNVKLDRVGLILDGNDELTVIDPGVTYAASNVAGKAVEVGGYVVADNTLTAATTNWAADTTTSGYYDADYYEFTIP